jgi:hypothetical protein
MVQGLVLSSFCLLTWSKLLRNLRGHHRRDKRLSLDLALPHSGWGSGHMLVYFLCMLLRSYRRIRQILNKFGRFRNEIWPTWGQYSVVQGWRGTFCFSFPQWPDLLCGPPGLLSSEYLGLFSGVRRLGWHHSLPSSSNVDNMCSHASTLVLN